MKHKKIGGIHFISIWRFRFSYCLANKPKPVKALKVASTACGMSAQERAAYWKARQAAQAESDRMGDMVTHMRLNSVNENRVFHGFKSV